MLESNTENRNWGCNCNCNCLCDCNMQSKCMNDKEEMSCECKKELREEMMMQLRAYKFSIVELALYLDTHPDDEKALCLHREYTKKSKELADKYQRMFGPLTIDYPCRKWRWLEEPWPWERGSF